jgi:Protein of unknown function (DUF4446)
VTATTLAGIAVGLAALALLAAVLGLRALARTRHSVAVVTRSVRRGEPLPDSADEVDTTLRRVAVVRFDAFPDLAGRLSFSAAILDESGSGLVLTSIAGRSETRLYAKTVTAGGASDDLSPEEVQAVKAARVGG